MSRQTTKVMRVGEEGVAFELRRSKAAKYLRLKVSLSSVAVIQPESKSEGEAEAFLNQNLAWVQEQQLRLERMARIRRPLVKDSVSLLLKGKTVRLTVRVLDRSDRLPRPRLVRNRISVIVGAKHEGMVDKAVERFLRRLARKEIASYLESILPRVGRTSVRFYLRSQRTKWGNCSTQGNLSFNWRLIMAPDYVLRYIVIHEAVHLTIPDHSPKFWLTVQSFCPETERARQWLCAFGQQLLSENILPSHQLALK